jgi:anti-anti-sigma regulatory factor
MPTEAVLLKIEDDAGVAGAVDQAAGELEANGSELVLDFSAVSRIDSKGLRALESLVRTAEGKSIKISLRDVNAGIYKVLKLMKLTGRLSFVS